MILVTGASGFLGKHIVQQLAKSGTRIRALYNSRKPDGREATVAGIEWMQCDLLDIYSISEAMIGVTYVYHCAAIVSFQSLKRDQVLHFNTESTANVVNAALEKGVKKFIHISSIAALGSGPLVKGEITEDAEWGEKEKSSAYGLSKYLAEMEVWRGVAEGLDAVMLNAGIILGGNSSGSLSHHFMKMAWKEFPFYSEGVNAWVDAADVAKAAILLMKSEITAQRFILSCGNYSYKSVLEMMATALDKRKARFEAGPILAALVWPMSVAYARLTGTEALITRETAANAVARRAYANNKLPQWLPGFEYKPIQETIREMAWSFLESVRK